jgi:hypothetical protein
MSSQPSCVCALVSVSSCVCVLITNTCPHYKHAHTTHYKHTHTPHTWQALSAYERRCYLRDQILAECQFLIPEDDAAFYTDDEGDPYYGV